MGFLITWRSPELRTQRKRSRLYGGGCQPLSDVRSHVRKTLHPSIPRASAIARHIMTPP
ncbi:hypothetical protein J0895_07665 [Phormidium pseudopriestleyi FRX01]|uniref:Uncharacterized protein n=1 Tax=Phormidium pseudopriestleyi FRX01 TaxID=1759528 RepID=A0ABS3FPD1_9CYAN|nr:hypothetical protein [Phormidium pseudopriestleyi]MBO0348979.1 hypothetical protein [Phormidium pseudopriestleyi FRX01]